MTNAIILHGTGCNPGLFWYPYIKKHLESKGYEVWVPLLPNNDHPRIDECLDFILKNAKFDSSTILIGHSSGCPLILSILERINVKVSKAVLVAGFARPLSEKPEPMVQDEFSWERIRKNCNDFIIINSADDPWGCTDKEGRYIFDNTGGKFII